ncbi:MAG TPA: AmiS/UreI family transporter [Acidiphilium sp.]
MLLGVVLFWVGAVLCLNGLWLLGKVGDKEIAIINAFVGLLTLTIAAYSAFGPGADAASVKGAALICLFSLTYLWVAWNRRSGGDGRGLGWYCLFVAITTIPVFIQGFSTAVTTWNYWFAICWLSWGVLWFLFFLVLSLGRSGLAKATGVICVLQGIYTCWVPGYLLLAGAMPGMAVVH